MDRARGFLSSSIGRKVVMAVTGFVLFGFVVAHMIGNLQVYLGPSALNAYAESLRKVPALLWLARGVLLLATVLHAWAAWSLTRDNRAARPAGYRERRNRTATYASLSMRLSGVLLLAFVVYHVLHLTTGTVHPSFVGGDVFHNFVAGFRVLWVSVFYMLAMVALGLHMYHGVWSFMHTLGLSHPRYDALRHRFAAAVTALVVLGNLSFPIAVLAGIVRETPRTAASAPVSQSEAR